MDENLQTSAEAHAEEALAPIATAPAADTPSPAAPAVPSKGRDVLAALASIRDRAHHTGNQVDVRALCHAVRDLADLMHRIMGR
jgi:hypothetical protein